MIDFMRDHHGQIDDTVRISGEVVGITAAFCRYSSNGGRGFRPVEGTTTTEPRSAVDPEERAGNALMFVGYMVALA